MVRRGWSATRRIKGRWLASFLRYPPEPRSSSTPARMAILWLRYRSLLPQGRAGRRSRPTEAISAQARRAGSRSGRLKANRSSRLPGTIAAAAYATPGQVQIANGPAGTNAIQIVSVPSGTSSTGPQFSGSFNSWFLDGQSFFASLSNDVWIYSTAGTQEAYLTTLSLSQGSLVGSGDLFWQGTSVYSVSTGSLIQTYPSVSTSGSTSYWSSGTTIVIAFSSVNPNAPEVQIVNLSGATPNATIQPTGPGLSPSSLPVLAALNPQVWVLAGPVIVDGPSLSATTARYFGYGQPSSIAGAPNLVALSTATGIHLLNPGTGTDMGDYGFSDGLGLFGGFVPVTMQLSTNGNVLATFENVGWPPSEAIPTLNVYSLPAASTLGSFTYPQSLVHPSLISFSLSGSGTTLGQVIGEGFGVTGLAPFTQQVTGVSGTPTIWYSPDDGNDGPLVLSPDGTLFAATNEAPPTDGNGVTSIYQNGTLVTTVPGYAEGWIDNSRLLVSDFSNGTTPAYVTSTIYSSTGQTLFTFPSSTLPQIANPQFTSTNSVYDPVSNAVYSLADGSNLWQGPTLSLPSGAPFGALAGPYVVYVYGHQLLLAQY